MCRTRSKAMGESAAGGNAPDRGIGEIVDPARPEGQAGFRYWAGQHRSARPVARREKLPILSLSR